jgi:hypothetical protein
MRDVFIATRNVLVGALAIATVPIWAPLAFVCGVFYTLWMLGTWIAEGCPTQEGM